jgi:copper oxidase (laccase) domain-containing protein
VARLFREADPEWETAMDPFREKTRLDLHAINRFQLLKKGVRPEHMDFSNRCTFCDPAGFPSFRREGKNAGRIISGIRLSNDYPE